MASTRDSNGRFVKGVRASVATEFKKGQHWRMAQCFRDKQYLLVEYVEKKRSCAEIAADFGVTEQAIVFWLRRHSIPRRSVSEARAVKRWGASGEKNPMFGKFGNNNPNYKHGRTPERQRVYSRVQWKAVVAFVHERDGHKCVRCGTSRHIGTHHLKSWKSHPEARLDAAQIVTICRLCHLWIHSKRNANYEYLSSRRHSG